MGAHTMREATAGRTPEEIRGMRSVYHNVRRILIDPSTTWEWNDRGYLERIEFVLAGTRYVMTANSQEWPYPSVGAFFYLMFDEAARLIKMEERIDEQKKQKKSRKRTPQKEPR